LVGLSPIEGDGCVRIPFRSNPRVEYKGEPTGTDA
jgi:hypothetical protein